jgi:predicted PurR-regulated permease PerM
MIVIGLVLIWTTGRFIIEDGGSVVFQVIMAWLASVAMEPAVGVLARHMKRGFATAAVMLGIVAAIVIFTLAFGDLLVEQVSNLIRAVPGLLAEIATWCNTTFGTALDPVELLNQLKMTPQEIAAAGVEVAGGLLSVLGNVLGGFFSLMTIGLFTFYFSADAPRLKRWIARLLPPRRQEVFLVVWDLAVAKTGGYVAARVVLAAICGGITAVFLFLIGMDYWLALGAWTGIVSQFVPTIGTYIAIALPVLVGFASADPVDGVLALIFALIYQQIENLTIEPKISADAVDMHPAVAFGAVLLGAALFGVAGALVAVPVAALILALVEIYSRKYELLPQLRAVDREPSPATDNGPGGSGQGPSGPAGGERRGRRMIHRRQRRGRPSAALPPPP